MGTQYMSYPLHEHETIQFPLIHITILPLKHPVTPSFFDHDAISVNRHVQYRLFHETEDYDLNMTPTYKNP